MKKTDSDDAGFFGVLSDISLEDYIQLICMNNTTKAIRVTQQDEKGLIFIDQGKIIYSSQDKLLGIDAFRRILSWKKGSFREVKIKKLPQPNINKDYRTLLLETVDPTAGAPAKATTSVKKVDLQAADTLSKQGKTRSPVHKDMSETKPLQLVNPDRTSPAGMPLKRKRAIFVISAILPICLITLFLQVFNFSSKSTAPAFAVTPSKTLQASSVAEQNPANPKAIASAQVGSKPPDVTNQSISISPLVKAVGKSDLPKENILRLHGSNTIGARLAPALVSGYLITILGAEKVEQLPGKRDNEVILKAQFKDTIKTVEIHAHGSTTGFKDLMAEQCDIGMASRKIKDKEVVELSRFGVMTAPTNEHVIALDGIAVIVNKSNKINTLNMQELADIFSGKTANWSQLGGESGEIKVYARDENSGTFDTFKTLVLDKLELKQGIKRFESNLELSDQVSDDPFAIGFTSLPNIRKAKAIAIADTGAKPIFPSFFTVATEDYPIARRLYLYTATNPTNNHVRDFIEFVQSKQGQEITGKSDLVDMNIKTFYSEKIDQSQIKNIGMVQDYLKATDNAQRLSLNFRFNSGKVALDNRGERDLNRVIDFLKERFDRKIVLAGFTDNAGDYDANLKLAKFRAEAVAEQLRARGVAVNHVASGGEELPVATNLSAAGKDKNRRVEVWLK
ncbi:MAG: substrate-binding domain-containing protein [Pseudomonadota bacterium]